ncbi:MAG: hypothetical protein M3Y76_01995 [Chloroflexota bacterium]|nr:hypothetical protein [Chloroflexota bacterium]
MGRESKTNGISFDLNPDMTTGVACTPLEQQKGVVLFKAPSSSQLILVDFLEHLREAAISQNSFSIFAQSETPGFDFLVTERLLS